MTAYLGQIARSVLGLGLLHDPERHRAVPGDRGVRVPGDRGVRGARGASKLITVISLSVRNKFPKFS